MRVKRTQYPKTNDDNVSKLSTDIKNFVIKTQEEIKSRDKIINEYAKIINETKKEYQKLNSEKTRFKQKLEQQQLEQEIMEEELRAYKQPKQYNRQFVQRPKKTRYAVKKTCYYLESETKSKLDFGYDENNGNPPKKNKIKKRNRRNLSEEQDSKDEMEDKSESESKKEEAKKTHKKHKSLLSKKTKKTKEL